MDFEVLWKSEDLPVFWSDWPVGSQKIPVSVDGWDKEISREMTIRRTYVEIGEGMR